MGYSKEVYQTVKARFVERRAAAFAGAEERRRALYETDGRFAALDREIQHTSRELILAAAPAPRSTNCAQKRRSCLWSAGSPPTISPRSLPVPSVRTAGRKMAAAASALSGH